MTNTPSPRGRTGDKPDQRVTQAVIVIHGIGEQRPMDTLRGLVSSVLPPAEDGGEQFFSKPDRLSESFELRKLQNRKQPRTHFYEYYWAHKVEGTSFRHVTMWLRALLLRAPLKVPRHLRVLWGLSWALVLLSLAGLLSGLVDAVTTFSASFPAAVVGGASALAFAAVQLVVLYFIGDAARYLSPHPSNVKLRQEIRADGVRLLRRIQRSGKYDRVILLGHSLGSVIAYDIIAHLWPESNEVYASPVEHDQPSIGEVETAGEALRANPAEAGVDTYRRAQFSLWQELRQLGSPWLVTDLITLGSPLAHAALLLARDEADLRVKQRQRELPTSPPEAEVEKRDSGKERRYSYRVWTRYKANGKGVTLRALHHGAPFACVRWTNLYFPARMGLFGDLIAGPIAPWFGPGVHDQPVTCKGLVRRLTPLAHTAYWRPRRARAPQGAGTASGHRPEALAALIEALDLQWNTRSE